MDIKIINKIIEEEIKEAKQINPVMALGMSHVKMVLNEYEEKESK